MARKLHVRLPAAGPELPEEIPAADSWAPAPPAEVSAGPGSRDSFRWLRLAVGSLMLAGLLALVLVVGRVPPLSDLITDPLFARRCLVLHVNLALGVWLVAFLASLAGLLPASGRRRALLPPWHALAAAGLLVALVPAAWPGVQPVLSNYVPALDHPLFLVGIGIFAFSAAAFFAGRILPAVVAPGAAGAAAVPPAVAVGLRAAMVVFLLAMVTLYASAVVTPRTYPAETYYELVFWGAGHMLQVVHAAGMLSCWILLVTEATGKAPIGGRPAGFLFFLLAAPAALGPLLAAGGTHLPAYHSGFTLLMRWGIWPVVLVFLVACLRHLAREGAFRGPRGGRGDPYRVGFYASAVLTLTGFALGALIRGPDTMVPAHYHAALGGVTAAYMATAFLLAGRAGRARPSGKADRLLPWQPGIYGLGQLIFALGFGFAGWHGAARKTYGSEQQAHSLAEQAGLAAMGAGGLVAVAGGLLFLWLLGRMLAPGASAPATGNPEPGDRHG